MPNAAKNAFADAVRRGDRLPELLCPAGSYEALLAAIEGGADAVYMGGVAHNARINAKNFTEDELERGIALAHAYGVKIYIAANTLVYDRGLDGFLRAAEHAYLAGADALIIADLGAAAEVHRRIPIDLHASTQCSFHSAGAVDALRDAGFSRMVCAREMPAEDIEHFIDTSPLEAEVFVHGALCVCHSGQCLFSSLVGGRSGNHGQCAQPCRLPFGGSYPLSLKDLTLARHIPRLCRMGVSSLKIEGRMKSPEYVRAVSAVWRRLLDGRRAASDNDIRELDEIFSRGGFTDGYFVRKINKSMLGVRSEEQKRVTRELPPFEGLTRKIPLAAKLIATENQPISLTFTRVDSGDSATVLGETPLVATNAPSSAESVRKNIAKLGDTPFFLDDLDCRIDGNIMLPASWLNSLRRAAIQKLSSLPLPHVPKPVNDKILPKGHPTAARTALFYSPEQIPPSAYSYFDIIYTPLEKYTGNTNGVALPPIIFDGEAQRVREMLSGAVDRGAAHVLVCNYAHLPLVEGLPLCVHGDFRLNVTNNAAMAFAEKQGLCDVILLPELTLAQIADIGGNRAVCVYGRVPLMVTEKCVGKELGDCKKCERGECELVDRRGVHFPVLRTFEHRSIIFNSLPIYMADKSAALKGAVVACTHFIFSVETAREADEVIKAYQNGATRQKGFTRIREK